MVLFMTRGRDIFLVVFFIILRVKILGFIDLR